MASNPGRSSNAKKHRQRKGKRESEPAIGNKSDGLESFLDSQNAQRRKSDSILPSITSHTNSLEETGAPGGMEMSESRKRRRSTKSSSKSGPSPYHSRSSSLSSIYGGGEAHSEPPRKIVKSRKLFPIEDKSSEIPSQEKEKCEAIEETVGADKDIEDEVIEEADKVADEETAVEGADEEIEEAIEGANEEIEAIEGADEEIEAVEGADEEIEEAIEGAPDIENDFIGEAFEDSVVCEETSPIQEGVYAPHISSVPYSERDYQEKEDKEMQNLMGALNKNTIMVVKEHSERVKVQHRKIISRQREQVLALQKEKQDLEKQIEQEKRKNTLTQALVEMKLKENKEKLRRQTEILRQTRLQYQTKLDQVAEIREKLHQSEEELKKIRTTMAEEGMKASTLVSSTCTRSDHTHWNMVDEEMTQTQAYLDSLMEFLPDENKVKNELAKRLRMSANRPATTGMFHNEPI